MVITASTIHVAATLLARCKVGVVGGVWSKSPSAGIAESVAKARARIFTTSRLTGVAVGLVGKSVCFLFLHPYDIAWFHCVNDSPACDLLFHILLSSARARIRSSGEVMAVICSSVYGGGPGGAMFPISEARPMIQLTLVHMLVLYRCAIVLVAAML